LTRVCVFAIFAPLRECINSKRAASRPLLSLNQANTQLPIFFNNLAVYC
jgi:hypothetical protein